MIRTFKNEQEMRRSAPYQDGDQCYTIEEQTTWVGINDQWVLMKIHT